MIRNRKTHVLVVLLVMLQVSSASASWMGDWLGSKSTSSGPNYLNGQARGYISGGSYSARWPVSQNNNLMSVQPPKLSAGCGGINFYAGSISFLKPDMLVKKLQNVMQNSAGLAFQLALDTFSPKVASYLGMMEDVSNKLNSMSMDDCTAAKGLVSGVRSLSEDIAEGYKMGELGTGISMGLSDSYSAIKQAVPAVATLADINNWTNTQKGTPAQEISGLSGCPTSVLELFPSDQSKYPVSILETVAKQTSIPAAHVNLLRGLAGDIIINSVMGGSGPPAVYKEPCSVNQNFTLQDIVDGNVVTMDKNGVCNGVTASDETLKNHVNAKMQTIMTSLQTRNALQQQDTDFITSMPTPVLYGLRMAVMSGQQSTLTPLLVNTAAAGLSMQAMRDLLARYEEILKYMDQTKGLSDDTQCRVGGIAPVIEKNLGTARERINKVFTTMAEGYSRSLQEFSSSFVMGNALQALNEQLKSTVAKNFGASVAQRVGRSL